MHLCTFTNKQSIKQASKQASKQAPGAHWAHLPLAPVQLSALIEPVNAVVKVLSVEQAEQAGLGTVMLPPADHVPSVQGVVQEVPVLPAEQMPTARWRSVVGVQQAQKAEANRC
jgi:hypothetical protein